MTNEQLWQTVLGELELSISKANFTTWFRDTYITDWNQETIAIAVPNTFAKAWLEQKYHPVIAKALQGATNNSVNTVLYKVEVVSAKRRIQPAIAISERPRQEQAPEQHPFGLNPRYRFETFVVGKGNELARAAAMAVTEKPGLVYNPLFLYGGVGLGKTHLMQAVGNKILESGGGLRVLYATSESFTNAFIQSVKRGEASSFKQLYRNVDVLLIDDIQFLAGKEGTQEEFFHTFNALHHNNKQIVLTSDRPPKAIPALESRLLSRFEWGMIADIGAPDLETRMAIIKQKVEERGKEISAEILQYLAAHVQNNIRELEGALNRILAIHELQNIPITLEMTKNVLTSVAEQPKRRSLTPKQLLVIVAEFYDITLDDIMGASRKRELVVPRQISMFLLREEIQCSYPNIGQELGGRDHTTAMHAYTKISQELESNEKIRQDVHNLRQRLYASPVS